MESKAPSITFFESKKNSCPVCGTEFSKETIRSGGGRLIAKDLTDELRRLYEPSKKFGPVYPLIYTILVCPSCLYSSFVKDFDTLDDESRNLLTADEETRRSAIEVIFPALDFSNPRGLCEGTASYFLAMMCYDHRPASLSPTIKQGLCSLRAAWLFRDLHNTNPNENYDYLSKLFYRKARFFYLMAVEYEGTGRENISVVGNLGPDTDKNYGYDGVLYLTSYLEFHYGPTEEADGRKSSLENAKRIAARIFGMGKASKNKPAAILDLAKDLHKEIGDLLSEEFNV